MTPTAETKQTGVGDGGPAFAAVALGPSGDAHLQEGMSHRAWFAGQALPVMIQMVNDCPAPALQSVGIDTGNVAEVEAYIARKAVAIADAMLAALSKAVSP